MQPYNEIDYQSLRRRLDRRLAHRVAFWLHFFVFFIFGWYLCGELIERERVPSDCG